MIIPCPECKNDKNVEQNEIELGKWLECDYCGVSYEISKLNEDGTVEIKIVEEEK